MGFTRAELIVENNVDAALVSRKILKKSEVRSLKVKVLVDTGAEFFYINEEVREKLGLNFVKKRLIRVADGSIVNVGVTEPVTIRWGNRDCTVDPRVLPRGKHCLLGVIPLESLKLVVDPVKRKLVKARGDERYELFVSVTELDDEEAKAEGGGVHRWDLRKILLF